MGKVRMVQSDKWKKRDCVVRYRAYADFLREQGATLESGDEVRFHLEMPRSWSAKKRQALRGSACTSKPDLDNLLGAVMDAIHPDADSHLTHFAGISKWWWDHGEVVIIRGALSSPTESCPTPSEPPSV
jgi:Holliday junction resolvase RusA-like endonuclease